MIMRSAFSLSDPRDRARSMAAAVAVHLAIGAALLTGLALKADRQPEEALKTFNVMPPLPPVPKPKDRAPVDQSAPAGTKANPTPIVAPPARIPEPQPIAAAPVAGTGAASTGGAAAAGSDSGAGGDGRGAGGGGIGQDAQLLGGFRGRVPHQLLREFAADDGFAHLLLTIGEHGDVTACEIIQSSGSAAVDAAFCGIMGRSRWLPARDMTGRPVSVQKRWTATWRK